MQHGSAGWLVAYGISECWIQNTDQVCFITPVLQRESNSGYTKVAQRSVCENGNFLQSLGEW